MKFRLWLKSKYLYSFALRKTFFYVDSNSSVGTTTLTILISVHSISKSGRVLIANTDILGLLINYKSINYPLLGKRIEFEGNTTLHSCTYQPFADSNETISL